MVPFIPPVVPVHHISRCPKCHAPEHIQRSCQSCGFVYPEHRLGAAETIGVLVVMVFIIAVSAWAFLTLLTWTVPFGEPQTLVAIIASQAHALWMLLHRIW